MKFDYAYVMIAMALFLGILANLYTISEFDSVGGLFIESGQSDILSLQQSETTNLEVMPSYQKVIPGDTANVDIVVTNVTGLLGLQLDIEYDS